VHGFCRMCNRLRNILGAPNRTSGDMGQVEARFDLFGDSVNLDAR
jgi:hypothetical protein